MTDAPWWVAATYLAYVLTYETLCIGGTGYVVFVLDHSGWWWVLGVMLSCGVCQPKRWTQIWRPNIKVEA